MNNQDTYTFPCGCSFKVIGPSPLPKMKYPALYIDWDNIPLDCKATYDLLATGKTKMTFQLEKGAGKQGCKQLKPTNIEHMSGLGSVLRPGCISGDTNISIKITDNKKRNIYLRKIKIRDLYKKFHQNHFHYKKDIVSLDEETHILYNNVLENVIYSGEKEVYRLKFKTWLGSQKLKTVDFTECTLDHPILCYDRGWIKLEDLQTGDRIAILNRRNTKTVSNGEKYFRSICYQNYIYKCVFCEWKEGSLDVNHLEDNRKLNNHPDNLCFLCPNHHRKYSEGNISKEDVITAREKYKLPNTKHIKWIEYVDKEYVGIKDTYDITVSGPHHNFVAGNVIVHNCANAYDENGISTTQHYYKRKNNEEEVTSYHPALDPILKPTYNCLIYQEQAMKIAETIAGFNKQEADNLRKAIGKKLPEEMAKVKKWFIEGAKKLGIVSEAQAAEIFGWIKESQKYSFNKAHSLCYGITGYQCAYAKTHFIVPAYTSWLRYARDKQKPLEEYAELVEDAKVMGVEVYPPNIVDLKVHFYTDGEIIHYGIANVKGIGVNTAKDLIKTIRTIEGNFKSIKDWSWYEFVVLASPKIKKSAMEALIVTGAFRNMNETRAKMLKEYEAISELSPGELKYVQENFSKWNNIITALRSASISKKEGGPAHDKRRSAKIQSRISMLESPISSYDDKPAEIANYEDKYLGKSITCNLADGKPGERWNYYCKDCSGTNIPNGVIILKVKVEDVREKIIKKGKEENRGKTMAYIKVSDSSCSLEDIACFPEPWEQHKSIITIGRVVEIQLEKSYAGRGFYVKNVWGI